LIKYDSQVTVLAAAPVLVFGPVDFRARNVARLLLFCTAPGYDDITVLPCEVDSIAGTEIDSQFKNPAA
jgi:hypothetical protein